jgi:hypothetical protein
MQIRLLNVEINSEFLIEESINLVSQKYCIIYGQIPEAFF